MEIEAKRQAEQGDSTTLRKRVRSTAASIESIFRQFSAVFAILKMPTLEHLQEEIAKKNKSMGVLITPETVADFSYLKVFPALEMLVLFNEIEEGEGLDADDGWRDTDDEVKAEMGRTFVNFGKGLNETSIVHLRVNAPMQYVSLDVAASESMFRLKTIQLNCCFRMFERAPAFRWDALETLHIGYKPIHYRYMLKSMLESTLWISSVPTLTELVLTNVGDVYSWHIASQFPNVEMLTFRYCGGLGSYVEGPLPKLKKLTYKHNNIYFLSNTRISQFPLLEEFSLGENKDEYESDENDWYRDHYMSSHDYDTDFCPSLKSLSIKWMPNVDSLILHEGAEGQLSPLTVINTDHATSDLSLGKNAGRIYTSLKHVIVQDEKRWNEFPLDILQLPSLESYEGPFHLDQRKNGIVNSMLNLDERLGPLSETPFCKELLRHLASNNTNILFFSSTHGSFNMDEEYIERYKQYQEQYAVLGFKSIMELFLHQRTTNLLNVPLKPLMLRDFNYLSLLALVQRYHIDKIYFQHFIPDGSLMPATLIKCTLGPHLLEALLLPSQILFSSLAHVVMHIDDDFLTVDPRRNAPSRLALDLQIKTRLNRRRVTLPHVTHFRCGTENASRFYASNISKLNLPNVQQIECWNVENVGELSPDVTPPNLAEILIRYSDVSEIPEQWSRFQTLRVLDFLNTTFRSMPAHDIATLFPSLLTLKIRNNSNILGLNDLYINAFGDEIVDDRYRFLQILIIYNVPLSSLTISSTQNMALVHLSVENNNELMETAHLVLSTPQYLVNLHHITWRNGYFPLQLFQLLNMLHYDGTYLLPPSDNLVFNLDELHPTTAHLRIMREIVAANPTRQIISTVLQQAEAEEAERIRLEQEQEAVLNRERQEQQERQRLGILQRDAPFFHKFHHDLICGRPAFWKKLMAFMEENFAEHLSSAEALQKAVEKVEMAANAEQKTERDELEFQHIRAVRRGEDVGELPPPPLDVMVVAKAALMETMAEFNKMVEPLRSSVTYENDYFTFRALLQDIPDDVREAVDMLLEDPDEKVAIAAFNEADFGIIAWLDQHGGVAFGKEWSYIVISPFYNVTCITCTLPFFLSSHQAEKDPESKYAFFLNENMQRNKDILAEDTTGKESGGLVVCNYTEYDYRKKTNLKGAGPLSEKRTQDLHVAQCNHAKHFFHRGCYENLIASKLVIHDDGMCIVSHDTLYR